MLDVDSYLIMLWHWLWLLIVGAVIGAFATLQALKYVGLYPYYESVATVTVGIEFEGRDITGDVLSASEDLVPSYVVLAELSPITDAVVRNLNLSISPSDLATYRLLVEQSSQTRVIQITAADPDPVMAAAIANEVAEQLVRTAPVQPRSFVQLVGRGKVPEEQSLEGFLIIALGGLTGLTLAAVIAVIIELKLDRPRTLTWAADRINAPVLGTFNGHHTNPAGRHIMPRFMSKDNSIPGNPVWWVVIETFKRALAEQGETENTWQEGVIVVTSPDASRTKGGAAVELAQAWATTGHKVILVDADSRRSAVDNWFGVPNETGVTTLLTQNGHMEKALEQALQTSATTSLTLLPSGPRPSETSTLLFRPAWDELILKLRQTASTVIINAPPVNLGPEAIILATNADGVLLAIDKGETQAMSANRAIEMLRRSGSLVLGTVVGQR